MYLGKENSHAKTIFSIQNFIMCKHIADIVLKEDLVLDIYLEVFVQEK